MKKIIIVVFLFVLLASFSGCGVKQIETTPSNPIPQEQAKVVKIDSDPEGATVSIDKERVGKTPCEYSLIYGEHNISFYKDDFETYEVNINVTKDKKEQLIMAVLKPSKPSPPVFLEGGEVLRFNDKPKIRRSPSSGIYLNDTLNVNGFTKLNSFDIVFPSGKKVHIDTENTGYKYTEDVYIRKFSKMVTFDEIGLYKIFSDNKVVTFASGGYREFNFEVLYKEAIVDSTLTLGSLNGNPDDQKTLLLPEGKEITVKLLLTDGKGNIARNKPIGAYDLKTDENGIVTIKIGSNGKDISPFKVYGDVLCLICDFTTFDKGGKLIETAFPNITKNSSVKVEEGHIFMSFDCSGLSLNDLGFKGNLKGMIIHPKDPSIIYINSFVSEDGGKSFERFGNDLTFDTIAIDPQHPNIIYGWAENNPYNVLAIFKSEDYGLNFVKIKDIEFVNQIVVDPKNSDKIYVSTNKELIRTTNGGKTWESLLACGSYIWINPQNTNIIYSVGCGFNRSKDEFKTWTPLNLIKDKPAEWNVLIDFAFDSTNSDVVYAITYSHLFKSDDNGENWVMATTRYFDSLTNIKIDPTNPKRIYLSSHEGFLESDDGGKNFNNLGFSAPPPNSIFNAMIEVSPTGELFAYVDNILFKRSAQGNWIPLNDIFIKEGPQWKVIDGEFYIDVKTVKSFTAAMQVTEDRITFYRLRYLSLD